MEAKEKALELWTTYRFALSIKNAPLGEQKDLIAKQCALIAVDEIIAALEDYGQDTMELQNMDRTFAWYYKVKEEIQNL